MTSLHRLFCAFLLSSASAASAADRLIVLGGEPIDGQVEAISADGSIRLSGSDQAVGLADLRSIQRQVAVTPGKAPVVVDLAGGGRLLGQEFSIVEEVCQMKWAHGADLKLPIDAVAAIRFTAQVGKDAAKAAQAFTKAMAARGEEDQLLVVSGDQVQTIDGLVNELGKEEISFTWQGQERAVPREKVFAIVLAGIGGPPDRSGQSLVTLTDGSQLWAHVVKLEAGRLHVKLLETTEVVLPWMSVASLAIKNDRLVFLSDLEPVEVAEQAVVTYNSGYQRDRSYSGNRLTLGKQSFEKGLGVHSRSQLTFANEGFDLLAATIGIDAETQGRGDCVFIVLADGEKLLEQRMTGTDPPRELQLKIAGAQRITLLVDVGGDLDLADHADWCDARFIKQAVSGPR